MTVAFPTVSKPTSNYIEYLSGHAEMDMVAVTGKRKTGSTEARRYRRNGPRSSGYNGASSLKRMFRAPLPPSPARRRPRRLRVGAPAAHQRTGRGTRRTQAAAPHEHQWRHAAGRLLLASQQRDAGSRIVPERRGGVRRRDDEVDRGAAEDALRRDALAHPGGRLDRAGADRIALVLPANGEGKAVPGPVPQAGAGRRGAGHPRLERARRGQEVPRPGRLGGQRRRDPARLHDGRDGLPPIRPARPRL